MDFPCVFPIDLRLDRSDFDELCDKIFPINYMVQLLQPPQVCYTTSPSLIIILTFG